ncbi:MAG: alcohol dehydrogenase catalytic domain-containing protein [Candidatus Binatia bacterium]
MHALSWDGNRLQLQKKYPTPQATEHLTLVRVHLAGICSTDLQILKGYMDFHGVPGHEFVGEVHEGPAELIGKRVVGEINFACGTCEMCQRGLGRHCPTRSVMGILNADGCFAEYLAVPAPNLHLVPDAVEDEAAVFSEPLAAAFEMLEQVHVQPTADVVVFGDGKLWLLCAQVLHLTGARVKVIGKYESKLRILRQVGIEAMLLSDWRSEQADIVVEATGSAAGLALAMTTVRPRGVLVLKSTVAQQHSLSLAPLVINEVTVIGSRCGRFPPALQALARKSIVVAPLMSKIFPLTEGVAALRHATRPGELKVLLRA